MDKFLETYNLPKLNREESENLSRHNILSEIEGIFFKTQQIKAQEQMASQVNFTKHSEKNYW